MKGPCSQKNQKHMTSDEMSPAHPMLQGYRGSDRHVTNARSKPKLLRNKISCSNVLTKIYWLRLHLMDKKNYEKTMPTQ